MKNILLSTLALAMTTSLIIAAGDGWMTDFEAAKKKAANENKALLVDFTGSDWCGWCIKLNDEVFKHEAFKEGVEDKFILVELDFPRDKSKISDVLQTQNKTLAEKYSIQGYPTILLMDSLGRPFAKTGYQAGGPEKYLAHLDSLLANKTRYDGSIAAAQKFEGQEKAKMLITALMMLPDDQLGHYGDIMAQISELDPDDEQGFVAEQLRKAALKTLQAEVMSAMRSQQSEVIPAKVDQFIADYKVTGEEKQNLLGMKMNPLIIAQQFDEALMLLDEIIGIAPESRVGKFAEEFKPRLQKMKEDAARAREE
ncbi:MAG: thioredoxin family protein [Akkermansiaceae bacterium]